MEITVVYQLQFTREMMEHPILQQLGSRFDLEVVLRRASLSETGGFAEVALSGTLEEANRALAWLQTTGVGTTGPIPQSNWTSAATGAVPAVGRGT
jgi:hypothetical protein